MIKVTFACGHVKQMTGAEEIAKCGCGETRVERVDAPPPSFRGHCKGPHAVFENLEAIPVSFER